MPDGDVVTYHCDGKWRNRIEGNPGFLDEFDTQENAVLAGCERARQLEVQHVVRNVDGSIAEHSSGRAP